MKKKPRHLSSQEGYNLYALNYDKKTKYLDSFEQSKLIPLLGNVKNKRILDVGAGTGRMAIELDDLGGNVTALDISTVMLEVLKKKSPDITTVIGDAEKLPFPESVFDIVVATFLIVHLKDAANFLNEAYRVLKPGGKLAFTNINQKRPPTLETPEGKITIESYYHRPEQIIEQLKILAFEVKKNVLVHENNTWINQIVLAEK